MRSRFLAAVMLIASATVVAAQEKPAPPASAAAQSSAPVQAKITVVITRQAGDRKVTSLPYVFGVSVSERTNLRMGSEVPIAAKAPEGGSGIPQGVTYRPVGTNIECALSLAAGGVFRLRLVIEDSSVHLDREQKSGNPAYTNEFPSFRSFKTTFVALLRDGQTMQHTSATDPVSGELMKVDVTLNVVK